MVTREELRKLEGQRAALQLAPQASEEPTVTGRILGILDAADGLVVTVEPDRAPGTRRTYHYHDIVAIKPQ